MTALLFGGYNGIAYMVEYQSFIKNSLACRYAYIVNLDTNSFEFWEGCQRKPQRGNRYGETAYGGYYPCKHEFDIPLDKIDDIDKIVSRMEGGR